MPPLPWNLQSQIASFAPADPAGVANVAGLMAGLGATCVITPQVTGRIKVTITGTLTNSTAAAGDGAFVQIRYGTGGAPANGAALTGTTVAKALTSVLERATANDKQTVCLVGIITGLVLNTQIWVDVALGSVVAGTGLFKDITCILEEV